MPRPAVSLGKLGASAALLVFAALAVASGLDRLTQRAPALARLVPPALQAQAARSSAALLLVRERPEAALASAERAVGADPVDPASTALLGAAYLMLGQPARAEPAFRVAARFGWREPMTQFYWFEAALQSGDLPRAVDRADALLRTYPSLPAISEVLRPLEATAAGRSELVRRLASRPRWLDDYLNVPAAVTAEGLARRGETLAMLAGSGTRLGCDRIAPFVNIAVARGSRDLAERVWTLHCPGAVRSEGLTDGGFDRLGRDTQSPFGWRTGLSGDVGLRTVEKGAGNRVLQLRNAAAVSRLVLRQSVSLQPGLYRLTARSTPGRIAASIGCEQDPPLPSLTDGDPASGGQRLHVDACKRLELGIWLRPGSDEVELDAIALEKVG